MAINNRERELWVRNHDGLYLRYRAWGFANKGGLRAFIKENKDEIDAVIRGALG